MIRNKLSSIMLLPLLLPACVEDDADPAPAEGETEATDERIIGGFPARSPRLNAVGAIGFPVYYYYYYYDEGGLEQTLDARRYIKHKRSLSPRATHYPYCSATLIAPNAIVTAEHCVDYLYGDEEFLIGFDATTPARTVPITGVVLESTISGGIVGLGSDVAVAFLAEPITDIAPLPYRTLSDSDVGTSYVGIGYGVRNNYGDAGQRYMGEMMLRGIGGNHALNIWGTLERYIEEYPNLGWYGDPLEDLPVFDLLDEYEASVGGAPGNAQDCYGDSGGPLARIQGRQLEIFGVVSGGVGTLDLVCDWGGVYAIFGPATLEMIDRALACGTVPAEGVCTDIDTIARCAPPEEGGWRVVETDCSLAGLICGEDESGELACIPDPCEGIPAEGMCEGDVAIRCSGPDEGNRRLLETDCSLIGGTCGFDEVGEVACIGATSGSCQGNCGGVGEGPDGSYCFCDSVCQDYGDCCADYVFVCEPEGESDTGDDTDTDGDDSDTDGDDSDTDGFPTTTTTSTTGIFDESGDDTGFVDTDGIGVFR